MNLNRLTNLDSSFPFILFPYLQMSYFKKCPEVHEFLKSCHQSRGGIPYFDISKPEIELTVQSRHVDPYLLWTCVQEEGGYDYLHQFNRTYMNVIFEKIAVKLGINNPSSFAVDLCIAAYEHYFLGLERYFRSQRHTGPQTSPLSRHSHSQGELIAGAAALKREDAEFYRLLDKTHALVNAALDHATATTVNPSSCDIRPSSFYRPKFVPLNPKNFHEAYTEFASALGIHNERHVLTYNNKIISLYCFHKKMAEYGGAEYLSTTSDGHQAHKWKCFARDLLVQAQPDKMAIDWCRGRYYDHLFAFDADYIRSQDGEMAKHYTGPGWAILPLDPSLQP